MMLPKAFVPWKSKHDKREMGEQIEKLMRLESRTGELKPADVIPYWKSTLPKS